MAGATATTNPHCAPAAHPSRRSGPRCAARIHSRVSPPTLFRRKTGLFPDRESSSRAVTRVRPRRLQDQHPRCAARIHSRVSHPTSVPSSNVRRRASLLNADRRSSSRAVTRVRPRRLQDQQPGAYLRAPHSERRGRPYACKMRSLGSRARRVINTRRANTRLTAFLPIGVRKKGSGRSSKVERGTLRPTSCTRRPVSLQWATPSPVSLYC